MYFIMNKSSKVGFMCLVLLTLTKGVFLVACGFYNFNEKQRKEENGSININYTINVTASPDVTDTFNADYKVCEGNSLRTACILIYDKDFNNKFKKDLSEKTGVTCYWEQRDVSSSVVAVDIHITQVVTRSPSVMIFSTARGGIPKPTRLIQVELLYPPKVTSLTVGGEDFAGPYFINEGQKVNISCSFDKGYPPAIFKLLDEQWNELKFAVSLVTFSLTSAVDTSRLLLRLWRLTSGNATYIHTGIIYESPLKYLYSKKRIVEKNIYNRTGSSYKDIKRV